MLTHECDLDNDRAFNDCPTHLPHREFEPVRPSVRSEHVWRTN